MRYLNLYLILVLVSFLVGIFTTNILETGALSFMVLLFFSCIFLWISVYIWQYRHVVFPLFIGYIFGIFLSLWTLSFVQENLSIIEPLTFFPQKIEVTIIDIYRKNDFSVDYVWVVSSIGDVGISENSIKTIVRIPANFSLDLGDTISYTSRIYMIESFDGFEYKKYMISRGIYFRSYGNTFERISSKNIHPLFLKLHHTRKYLLEQLDDLYPKEEKIFLWGILLWAREDIPPDLKTDFNNSGLTHFIAVSGFNITILIIFFGYLFQYFPLTLRTILIITSILLFMVLVWFSAPVIRAGVMGIIGYLILVSGRKAESLTIVLITAACMVTVSPLSLNYDVSFHLSFLAVIGIVYTQGFLKKWFSFLPETFAIREAFILTIAALSFTLPIMVFNFWQVSLLAPLANIAVTWTIPLAMLLGFLSLIAYIIYPPLGYIIAFFDWVLLKYDIMMVHFFGNIQWALLQVDLWEYAVYIEILYFILLTFLIVYFGQKKKAV